MLEKFKTFLKKPLNQEALKNLEKLKEFGITSIVFPESLEDFEEIELHFKDEVILSIVVLNKCIERILFLKKDPSSKEGVRDFSTEEMVKFLSSNEESLLSLFFYLTKS